MSQEEEFEWIPLKEAAKLFGVDPSTLRRWCTYGEVPAKKREGFWWLHREVVAEIVRASKQGDNTD